MIDVINMVMNKQVNVVLLAPLVSCCLTAQIAFATNGNGTTTICVINATQSCIGKVVGASHPWIAPQPINITGNTTMVAMPLNATATTNEQDYRAVKCMYRENTLEQ
jgi:hypothetical protein